MKLNSFFYNYYLYYFYKSKKHVTTEYIKFYLTLHQFYNLSGVIYINQ